MKISVVIQTYNSEQFLERVLDAVKDFDEIVLCDMYSTDKTLDIAAKYNCKIVFHEYTGGIVEPARNFAISQASNQWVLLIDSDEVVTEELKKYLYEFIKTDKDVHAIRIPRKNYFMGRFMHGSYPDYILRFFKKDAIYWPPTVHAKPKIKGITIDIPRKNKELAFIHLVNSSIYTRFEKLNTYTNKEVTRRKDKKYKAYSLLLEPFGRFLHYYVFKSGYKDGIAGLIFAIQGAVYKYATIAKVLEAKTTEDDYDKELMDCLRK